MCPMCIATAAWIASGTSSAGVLLTLFVKRDRQQPTPSDKATQILKTPGAAAQTRHSIGDQTMKKTQITLASHNVVSEQEWLQARRAHLLKEKEFTRQRDELSRQRRELPWVKVEKSYTFDTPDGNQTLADLFAGRSQLIVYHFMFGPGWKEGCKSCSFLVDHLEGAVVHLEHHDVSVAVVSRAPLAELEAYKQRMGWQFGWVSSNASDFNFDYHVSFSTEQIEKGKVFYNFEMDKISMEELPGISVFYKDADGTLFHTYSSYARGGDLLLTTYNYLDLTPKGRNESGGMDWVKRHDEYDAPAAAKSSVQPKR